MEYLVGWIIGYLFCSLFCGMILEYKGREFSMGFMFGFIGLLGIIVSLFIPKDKETLDKREIEKGNKKRCEYCKSVIPINSIKCEKCLSVLVNESEVV